MFYSKDNHHSDPKHQSIQVNCNLKHAISNYGYQRVLLKNTKQWRLLIKLTFLISIIFALAKAEYFCN